MEQSAGWTSTVRPAWMSSGNYWRRFCFAETWRTVTYYLGMLCISTLTYLFTLQRQRTLLMTVSSSRRLRPTSTRVVFHGPTLGSATGALQPLDRGFGTVCQPARQWHWRISSAAKVVFVQVTLRCIVTFWFYVPLNTLNHSLTHSLTYIAVRDSFK